MCLRSDVYPKSPLTEPTSLLVLDLDIHSIADILIREHGEDAAIAAAMHIETMFNTKAR